MSKPAVKTVATQYQGMGGLPKEMGKYVREIPLMDAVTPLPQHAERLWQNSDKHPIPLRASTHPTLPTPTPSSCSSKKERLQS